MEINFDMYWAFVKGLGRYPGCSTYIPLFSAARNENILSNGIGRIRDTP